MRAVDEILKDLNTAKQQWHDGHATRNKAEDAVLATKIEGFQKELVATITEGASVCPACSNPPHGMLKNHGHAGEGATSFPMYEIGCLHCGPKVVDEAGMTTTTYALVRAPAIALAVKAWNDRKFLVRHAVTEESKT